MTPADLAAKGLRTTGWQSMESAPRDGTPFLALPWTGDLHDASVTFWMDTDGRFGNWMWSDPPILWLEMPDPSARIAAMIEQEGEG